MQTIWIKQNQLDKALARNEAFWEGRLEEYPIIWVTVPNAKKKKTLPEPAREEEMWTDVDYVMDWTENELSSTYYAGDALPVFNPWLGPDQFSAWLGADITLKPKDFTSWIKPFVDDWAKYPELKIDPENKWWKIYLDTLRRSAEVGKDKWVTGYPDLHTGIDALCAIRGPENLMIDLMTTPEAMHGYMGQVTELWKFVVDTVSEIVLPAGQGTSNWTMGWSEKRFVCVGQNDFSCLLSPKMFDDFCKDDNVECCNYVDHSLYHLDGPDAARHLPSLLEIERLDAIQWIQGAGKPYPSKWLDMLRQIQAAGKGVQVLYAQSHCGIDNLNDEIKILCESLDTSRLFIWAIVQTVEQADAAVRCVKDVCQKKCKTQVRF